MIAGCISAECARVRRDKAAKSIVLVAERYKLVVVVVVICRQVAAQGDGRCAKQMARARCVSAHSTRLHSTRLDPAG